MSSIPSSSDSSSSTPSSDIFQSVLDTLPFCIFWKDRDGVFLGCNQAMVEATGHKSVQDYIGKTDYDFSWTKEESDFFRECDRRVMDSGKAEVNIIESLRQTDGSLIWLETSKVPLTDDNGEIIGVLGAFHDITKRKLLEDENVANQKLDSLSSLAAGLAHDFNNILMMVLGSCQLAKMKLTKGASNTEIIKYLENIEIATAQASVLTEKFMNYSERSDVTKTVCNLSVALKEMTALVQSSINTPIKYEVIDKEGELYADVNQIHQVMNNLLINASQASQDNQDIIVSIKNCNIEMGNKFDLRAGNYFAIEVKDFGVGISNELKKDIFKPYFTTKKNGHGLGLSSCSTIVKNHNGTIHLSSEPGKGSTFTVYLPILEHNQEINANNLAFSNDIVQGSGRILYIEDDQTTQAATVEMLTELGYQVTSYSDLQSAIAYIKYQPNSFDLILTDFILLDNVQGGLAILDKIREQRPDCPVVLVTGYFEGLEQRESSSHQFSYIAQKPIGIAKISQIINRFINHESINIKNVDEQLNSKASKPINSRFELSREQGATHVKNILVVDDEPLIVKFLESYLSFYGYNVVCADSGENALEKITAHTIDLIITDQNMPKMSGIELSQAVKKLLPAVPIVICSGYIEDIGESYIGDSGISYFHKKSESPEQLMGVIGKLLA